MTWYQLAVKHCPESTVEALSSALEHFGALSVSLLDANNHPVLEPAPGHTPLWPEVSVSALFDSPDHATLARFACASQFSELTFETDNIPDQVWERVWMDTFKPQCFGEKLWICPSWAATPIPGATQVLLDPGLAFGTGMHPTTALCLQWLDQHDLGKQTLIDYGCGSGILALAAAKLGAQYIQAVDIDPQALLATAANCTLNNIAAQQLVVQTIEALQGPVDIILANILLDPLLLLRDRFHGLLATNGILVISGILIEQISGLVKYYEDQGFIQQDQHCLAEWGLVVFRKIIC